MEELKELKKKDSCCQLFWFNISYNSLYLSCFSGSKFGYKYLISCHKFLLYLPAHNSSKKFFNIICYIWPAINFIRLWYFSSYSMY